MTQHQHIDVEATMADFRAVMANTLAGARARAKNDKDLAYIDLQHHYQKVTLTMVRLDLEAKNLGYTDLQRARALGVVLGTMHGQCALEFSEAGIPFEYFDRYSGTFEALLGNKRAAFSVGEATTKFMQGGRA